MSNPGGAKEVPVKQTAIVVSVLAVGWLAIQFVLKPFLNKEGSSGSDKSEKKDSSGSDKSEKKDSSGSDNSANKVSSGPEKSASGNA